jgi:outer membrane usher protein
LSKLYFLFTFLILSIAQAQTHLRSALVVDQASLGDVEIQFEDPEKEVWVSKHDLETTLAPLILEDKWRRLRPAESAGESISLRELDRIGIHARFDERTLELICVVPLEIRRVQDVLLDHSGKSLGLELDSTTGSGYLNLSALQGYTTTKDKSADHDPLEGQAELVQNLGPVTLESLNLYKEMEEHPWERGDTSLAMDLEDRQTRIRLGDSTPLTTDYMTAMPAGGLHVYRQFGIDPARPSIGLRSAIIQVTKPSWLEISVNRVLISKLRVPVGPLNLRNLPLLIGRNRVHIKLIDDFEKTEEFDVDLFFDNNFLGPGVHDFSYFVGRPWISQNRERQYQSDGVASLLHRYGLNEFVTLGVDAQSFEAQRVAGAEIGLLTTLGSLQTNIASSRSENQEGQADHWRFRSSEQEDGFFHRTRFLLDYEHRSSAFSLPSPSTPSLPDFASKVEGNFQTLIWPGKSLTYGAGYQWGQNGFQDSRFYRAGFQTALFKDFRLDISAIKTFRDQQSEEQWLLNLTWSEPVHLISANVLQDSLNRQTLLSLHKSARRQNQDFSVDASLQKTDDLEQVNLRGDYLTSKADLLLQQDSSLRSESSTHQTRFGVATALAWAGGRVALSRPIRDSFALLSAREMPSEGKLRINPSSSQEAEAILQSDDSLVLPNLTSYQRSSVLIDSTTLPIGYSLGRETYRLRPRYRSGLFVDLGLTRQVYTRGQLLRANGKALAFADGQIFNEKNQLVSEAFFTDAEGRFVLDQLKPGAYRIQLRETGWKHVPVQLPDAATELKLDPITVIREEGM